MKFEDNVYTLIDELEYFDYHINSIDHIWDILFLDKKEKWNHLCVTKYQEVYYIGLIDGDLTTLEVQNKKSITEAASFGRSTFDCHSEDSSSAWNFLIISALNWLKLVKKDWIKANKMAQEHYPLNRRLGFAPNTLVRASLSDVYRIDQELGKSKTKKFIHLVESGYFRDEKNTIRSSMTANDFFAYCKIAYAAGQRKEDTVNDEQSGRAMYQRYADGRHEGLLEIDSDSATEFADWIDEKHPKRERGGHPFEIKRGGNTTHIDLCVSRPSYHQKEGFTVRLRGSAISRLKETICMFLAIYDTGLPITIADPESIRKRLLAQDNIGIIPCYNSLHRANQYFREDQSVYDVLHYDDFGRYKTRMKPFITWDPLPILKPKYIF